MDEKKRISALGADYAAAVAKKWPELPHAPDVIEHLPSDISEMLQEQGEGFLAGWYNAVAMVHDLGIKVLISELVKRNKGIASDERDVLLTRVGAVVECLGYFACKEATLRRKPDESEADTADEQHDGQEL